MSDLVVHLSNGITLAVPPSLQSVTTYVLLEQETWFEKELALLPHVLRPGMTAIDIGANLGIYALAMARLVAPGRVYAYEPASEPRALLARSRELNGAANLEISGHALSDTRRQGQLAFAASSEMSALGEGGPGEPVEITSLDLEEAERCWPAPDFVKIDAEGEEERVLAGGAQFFARHSPLVMVEIKVDDAINERLLSLFPAIGYRFYRSLPGAAVLVPVDPEEAAVESELNLFAAKPDRARALAQAGLLVEAVADCQPDARARSEFLALWRKQTFAPAFASLCDDPATLEADYRDALAAYGFWRGADNPLPARCAALFHAFRLLSLVCRRAPDSARLSTLARVAWEAGERLACIAALRALIDDLQRGALRIREPFWPACPRFDTVAAGGRAGEWFLTSVLEQYERTFANSSLAGGSPGLEWLCAQPLASIEMQRRRVLIAARGGAAIDVPPQLGVPAPDHRNAEVWRAHFRDRMFIARDDLGSLAPLHDR